MEPTDYLFDTKSGSFYFPTSGDYDVLIAGLAHHFNNIFAIIRGYSDMQENMVENKEKVKQNFNIIYKTTSRGVSIVDKLQVYTQKKSVLFEVIDLELLIRDAVCMSYEYLGNSIKILFQQHSNKVTLVADRKLLREAVCQLLYNASDAMPEGGKINMSLNIISDGNSLPDVPAVKPGSYVTITVKDTGVGIEESIRENVFEPFFTTKEVGRGVGLGLSVVYGVVARHKGFIHLESKPNEGSTFTLFLPLS